MRFEKKVENKTKKEQQKEEVGWMLQSPRKKRITSTDRVSICVQHFNHLRYVLKTDVSTEKSEAYAYLDKLWGSILTPTLGSMNITTKADTSEGLVTALRELYETAVKLDGAIGEELGKYRATGLTDDQADGLTAAIKDIGEIVKDLNVKHGEVQEQLSNNTAFEEALLTKAVLYDKVIAFYGDVLARSELFLQRAQQTVGVDIRPIGKYAAGTKVTAVISAHDERGEEKSIASVTYLTEGTFPLVLHGGLAFSSMNDVTFKKVRRVTATSSEDLFQETADEENSEALLAFLGARVITLGEAKESGAPPLAVLLSLGTDIQSPGKAVYAGPTLLFFDRIALTAGVVLGKEKDGEAQTLEPNIYRILREEPSTGGFFSVSVRVP